MDKSSFYYSSSGFNQFTTPEYIEIGGPITEDIPSNLWILDQNYFKLKYTNQCITKWLATCLMSIEFEDLPVEYIYGCFAHNGDAIGINATVIGTKFSNQIIQPINTNISSQLSFQRMIIAKENDTIQPVIACSHSKVLVHQRVTVSLIPVL